MRRLLLPPLDACAALAPEVTVHALLPDDQRRWVHDALTRHAVGARVVVLSDEMGATATGWPRRVVVARLGLEGGAVEFRVGAFFAFFEHAADVVGRCASEDMLAEMLPAFRAAMADARPVFVERPVALSDLVDVRAAHPSVRTSGAMSAAVAPAPPVAPVPVDEATLLAWERAGDADPGEVDALYDAGQARYLRGEFERALALWTLARARAPGDFGLAKKQVQALHALGRHVEADAMLAEVREIWKTSNDPGVRLVDEVVIDQRELAGIHVNVLAPLRVTDETHALLTIRVLDATPPILVRVETSAYARERGTPFVLSLAHGRRYRALRASEQMPAYPELLRFATGLIASALAAGPPSEGRDDNDERGA